MMKKHTNQVLIKFNTQPSSPVPQIKHLTQANFWNTLTLGHPQQLNHHYHQLLLSIQEWQVINLHIHQFKSSSLPVYILTLIQNINFSKLKLLKFTEVHIDSIEPLSRLRAPSLKYLYLGNLLQAHFQFINITDCRSLRKMCSKQLGLLDLNHSLLLPDKLDSLNEGNWQYLDCIYTKSRLRCDTTNFIIKQEYLGQYFQLQILNNQLLYNLEKISPSKKKLQQKYIRTHWIK